jgi:hypothetical protein
LKHREKPDVKLLPDTLTKQGVKKTVKNVADEVPAPYRAIQKMGHAFKRQDSDSIAVTEEEMEEY